MRRYHPDKHIQADQFFIDSINQICGITNKVYEALANK